MKFLVLDSTPLGLLTQRAGARDADAARRWLSSKTAAGMQAIVPEIVDYEIPRELIRVGKAASIRNLDRFNMLPNVRFVPINSAAIRYAAVLWGQSAQPGAVYSPPAGLGH